jgi:hypothetical protein
MRRRPPDDWDTAPPNDAFGTPGGLSGPETERTGPWGDAGVAAYQLAREQNLLAGILAGLVAGAVGVAIWVGLVAGAGAPIPFMALGVGYLVGFAVRWAGKGIERSFGIAAGLITLAGCIAGTVLSVATILAERDEVPLAEFLEGLDAGLVIQLLLQSVGPIGAVVWLFAIYESFRVATVVPPQMALPKGEHDHAFEQEPPRHE